MRPKFVFRCAYVYFPHFLTNAKYTQIHEKCLVRISARKKKKKKKKNPQDDTPPQHTQLYSSIRFKESCRMREIRCVLQNVL